MIFPSSRSLFVTDPLYQILFLARFLCFMAMFYLALHKLVARLSKKPDSRLLWFFGVLTAPLIRPVRALLGPGGSENQLLTKSLFAYGLLWLCFVVLGAMVRPPR